MLEQLSRRVERVAVFRPVVRPTEAERDYVLDLLVSHDAVALSYDECAGVTYDDVHPDPDAALDRIVDRYHQVAEKCDAVVVVGSDYTDVGAPTEFSFNARVAANLGSPVLLVLNGTAATPSELRTAADLAAAELRANHGTPVRGRSPTAWTRRPATRCADALSRARRAGVRASPRSRCSSAPSVGDTDGGLRRHAGQRRRGAAGAGGDRRTWSRR